jgi:hypothetical protein
VNLEQRPGLVRATMAAALIVFVVALIGAVTVDSDDSSKDLASSGSTSTTASADTSTTIDTGTTAPASTTTQAPATTRPLSPTTAPGSAQVPDPGPTKPPAAGIYTYAITSSAEPSSNGNTDAKVEVLPSQNGAARRKQTFNDGQGNTLANEETWASDAMRVTTSKIVSQQATVDCTWQPPLLVLQLPLAIGKTWSTDSTCTTMVGGTQVTIKRTGQSKVIGKVVDKIGDQSVGTWIIDYTGNTTVRSAFFNTDTSEKITRHFASAQGLVTYEKGSGTMGGSTTDYERRLQNLTPK